LQVSPVQIKNKTEDKTMKKLMSTCTALLLAVCMLLPAYSAFAATDNDKIGERLEKVTSQTEGATSMIFINCCRLCHRMRILENW
jgi:hypothetical protein